MGQYSFSRFVIILNLLLLSTFCSAQLIGGTPAQLGPTCGPPNYLCSRFDLNAASIPSTVPSVGGLTGVNNVITDDLGNNNRILRITDANSNPAKPNKEYVTAGSGSGDDNLFSQVVNGHYLVATNDTGNGPIYLTDFNSGAFTSARIYTSLFASTGGMTVTGPAASWAFTSNKLYVMPANTSQLTSYDFTDWLSGPQTTPPTTVNVFNYNTGSTNCLPVGYNVTWTSDGGHTKDDQVFGAAFSNSGGQGTGTKAASYKVGSGCSSLDTSTGVVTGDYGSTGTITLIANAPFTIHNSKMFKSGSTAYLLIACQNAIPSGNCPTGTPYAWQIGTLNVYPLSQGHGGGHFTEGYGTWYNGSGAIPGQQTKRPVNNPTNWTDIFATNQIPTGMAYPQDFHVGWNNVDTLDTVPVLMTTYEQQGNTSHPGTHSTGVVSCSGSIVTWVAGHQFISTWTGSITIGGLNYTISGTPTTTSLTTSTTCTAVGNVTYAFAPYTVGWEGEVIAVNPVTGVVNRFTHTMNTGEDASIFDAAFRIGAVSQDGKYFVFTSDMFGTLGSKTGSATGCTSTAGTNSCRSDNFIVELK